MVREQRAVVQEAQRRQQMGREDETGNALGVAEPEMTAWSMTSAAVPVGIATAMAVNAVEIVRPMNERRIGCPLVL